MKKNSWHLLLMAILCVSAFCWCLYRDIRIEKQYGVDLRNRIVGARLQMDGHPPYFYKWKPEDGLRYHDPAGGDTTYANAITASPFFHHLLYPIANLPQRQISQIWLGIQYALLICSMLIAFSFTGNIQQRWAVTITGVMCLFTTAWTTHIHAAQTYLVFPFLCLSFIFFLRRKNSLVFSFLAGLIAVILLLSRPTMILFFLPFLLLAKRYSLKYLIIFFIPVVIVLSYSLLNDKERSFWIDYKKGIAAHIADHQSSDHEERSITFKPIVYKNWEGWNQDSIEKEKQANPIDLKTEFAGVQEMTKKAFHQKLSTVTLTFSFAIITILLLSIFIIKRWNDPSMSIAVAALFGFCLYMLSDLFSPILRYQYYTVQWIFPLLFCASFYDRKLKWFYLLLFLGLLLNILTTPYIKMRHTLGEYLIIATLLWFCIFRQSGNKPTE